MGYNIGNMVCFVMLMITTMLSCNSHIGSDNHCTKLDGIMMTPVGSAIDTVLISKLLDYTNCDATLYHDSIGISTRGVELCNSEVIVGQKRSYSHQYLKINNIQYTKITYLVDYGLDTKTQIMIIFKSPLFKDGLLFEGSNNTMRDSDTLFTNALYVIVKNRFVDSVGSTIKVQSNIDSMTFVKLFSDCSPLYYSCTNEHITIDYSRMPFDYNGEFYKGIILGERQLSSYLPSIVYHR